MLTEGQREAFGLGSEETEQAYPRFLREWIKRWPLRRTATPDEQARVVLFLVSDASAFVTGQCLVVDGGALLV